jgi:hypothetical protein
LHRLYCAFVVHPDVPPRRSTSLQSVALALAVCPVIPLCIVTTRLTTATDILRLRRASGCLGTSRGSSRGPSRRSSSITSPTPRVRKPLHVALLVVDYFTYAACPGASSRRAARLAARRRLLRLCRASWCLGKSRGSSRGSLSTTPCASTSSGGHTGSASATPYVATTCLATTLALLRVRCVPPRRHLPVASRREG